MAPSVQYQHDSENKEHEETSKVKYKANSKNQDYQKQDRSKEAENKVLVKYLSAGSRASKHSTKCTNQSRDSPLFSEDPPCHEVNKCGQRSGEKPVDPNVASKCFEIKRSFSRPPCKSFKWSHGTYKKDECGSGIVSRKLGVEINRKLWCKTPLSMYQATVGELGRKILCREITVPRDVNPEPPCNVCEYIMPPCKEYYRKYDCMRPCEEQYTYYKNGQKCYRDRVERYWEPCVSDRHKVVLDVNQYGPHNAALALELRRKRGDVPCW